MKTLKTIVLASKSPRRIALLKQIGIRPNVVPSHIPEDLDPRLSPAENATLLSLRKAQEVAAQFADAIVIGADTIVIIDGRLLGKPTAEADARAMLRLLSGRTHEVVTGFSIVDCDSGESVSGFESTRVTFRDLPDEEIDEYIAGGSPMDKAGAYGIQDDYGAVFVTRIEGCFYNVVGFPLSRFYTAFRKFHNSLMERSYAEEN